MALPEQRYILDLSRPHKCESWLLLSEWLKKGLQSFSDAPWLWVGAGCSKPNNYPTGHEFAEIIFKALSPALQAKCKEEYDILDYQQVADFFIANRPLEEFDKILDSRLGNLNTKPGLIHLSLAELPWNQIITTNYDPLMENAWIIRRQENIDRIFTDNFSIDHSRKTYIWKIHGTYNNWRKIILSGQSYRNYKKCYQPLSNMLVEGFKKHPVFFIGCSMKDERLSDILLRIVKDSSQKNVRGVYVTTKTNFENTFSQDDFEKYKTFNILPLIIGSYSELNEVLSELPRVPDYYDAHIQTLQQNTKAIITANYSKSYDELIKQKGREFILPLVLTNRLVSRGSEIYETAKINFSNKCPVLLLGHAGQGKTLFLTKVAEEFLETKEYLPVLLDCKNLPTLLNLTPSENLTPEDISSKLDDCYIRHLPKFQTDKLVFFIDGYDELFDAYKTVFFEGLVRFLQKAKKTTSSSEIIKDLFSRLATYSDKYDKIYNAISDNARYKVILSSRFSAFNIKANNYFYTLHFKQQLTESQRDNFIKTRVNDIERQSSLINFCRFQDDGFLNNYLLLYFIVNLFNTERNIQLIYELINGKFNSSQIYEQIIRKILIEHEYNKEHHSLENLQNLLNRKIAILSEIAYRMIFYSEKLTWDELLKEFAHSEKIVNSINLIFKINSAGEYDFVHRTYAEYFCALKIFQDTKTNLKSLVQYYQSQTDLTPVNLAEHYKKSYFRNNTEKTHGFMSEMAQVNSNNEFIKGIRYNAELNHYIEIRNLFYLSDFAPTVIHLNLAPGNYPLGKKAIAVMHYLNDILGFDILLTDGAKDKVDTGIFTKTVVEKTQGGASSTSPYKVKMDVAEYFLKKGEISYIDYFNITMGDAFIFMGVEDKDIYLELNALEKFKLNQGINALVNHPEKAKRYIQLFNQRSYAIVCNTKKYIQAYNCQIAFLDYFNNGELGILVPAFFAVNGLNYIEIAIKPDSGDANSGFNYNIYKAIQTGQKLEVSDKKVLTLDAKIEAHKEFKSGEKWIKTKQLKLAIEAFENALNILRQHHIDDALFESSILLQLSLAVQYQSLDEKTPDLSKARDYLTQAFKIATSNNLNNILTQITQQLLLIEKMETEADLVKKAVNNLTQKKQSEQNPEVVKEKVSTENKGGMSIQEMLNLFVTTGQKFYDAGKFMEATQSFEMARELAIKDQGISEDLCQKSYAAYLAYSSGFYIKREYGEAIKPYLKYTELLKKQFGKNHIKLAAALYRLGLICNKNHLFEKAIEYAEAALKIFTGNPEVDFGFKAQCRTLLKRSQNRGEINPYYSIIKKNGSVLDNFQGLSDKTLVLINDFYVNYNAQKNIYAILNALTEQLGLKLIATGITTKSLDFRMIESVKLTPDEMESLVKENILTGTEKYCLETKTEVDFYSAENDAAYHKLNSKRVEIYSRRNNTYLQIRQEMDSVVSKLKEEVFSKEIKNIHTLQDKNDDISLFNYIFPLAQKHHLDFGEFNNVVEYKKLLALLQLNFDLIGEQHKKIAAAFIALKEKFYHTVEFLNIMTGFADHKIPEAEYYSYCLMTAVSMQVDVREWGELTDYTKALSILENLDKASLAEEKDDFVQSLKNKLLKNEDEEAKLDKIIDNLKKIDALYSLQPSYSVLQEYYDNRELFSLYPVHTVLKGLASDYNHHYNVSDTTIRKLDLFLDDFEAYYQYASKRASYLLENTLQKMDERKGAILVTQNYYINKIKKILQSRDITYLVIMPGSDPVYVEEIDDYVDIVLGKKKLSEEVKRLLKRIES